MSNVVAVPQASESVRRVELSFAFDARRCNNPEEIYSNPFGFGDWRKLYDRPYFSLYLDTNGVPGLRRRGVSVCIADRLDVEDSEAVLSIKRMLPIPAPFMLRREHCFRIPFSRRLHNDPPAYRLASGSLVDMSDLGTDSLTPTAIHMQFRRKRVCHVDELDALICWSYDTGNWYTATKEPIGEPTAEFGLEVNLEDDSSTAERLIIARRLLSVVAREIVRDGRLPIVRVPKYARFLAAKGR